MESWRYDWLISCPLILVLGWFKLGRYRGAVFLPLTNFRLNIFGKGRSIVRVVSNISYNTLFSSIIHKVCREVSMGQISNSDFLTDAFMKTMYYGGYNLFIDVHGEAIPLTIEYIDTENYWFYLKLDGERCEMNETNIEPWLLLGAGLRTGRKELVYQACSSLGAVSSGKCVLTGEYGELVITSREYMDKPYIRVVPDNNSLRHVVKV
ncbi:MAG: hypothetical protein B6U89_06300 [Desulfurococcales archaeon ex4484_58]|nr:MAG: hypothetical protein B6U89_06300 [Desulfurococcales archaeon ex4484_58]